mmetsp:Transcript_14639/g.24993  ORF Transcript_14639/g.24993 Transcript_14639/m.24993 type:complete len:252 (-) Transcript_14639:926-1681(-)
MLPAEPDGARDQPNGAAVVHRDRRLLQARGAADEVPRPHQPQHQGQSPHQGPHGRPEGAHARVRDPQAQVQPAALLPPLHQPARRPQLPRAIPRPDQLPNPQGVQRYVPQPPAHPDARLRLRLARPHLPPHVHAQTAPVESPEAWMATLPAAAGRPVQVHGAVPPKRGPERVHPPPVQGHPPRAAGPAPRLPGVPVRLPPELLRRDPALVHTDAQPHPLRLPPQHASTRPLHPKSQGGPAAGDQPVAAHPL